MGILDSYNSGFRNMGVDDALKGALNFHLSWNKERTDIYESSNLVTGYQNSYRGLTTEKGIVTRKTWQKKLSTESVNAKNIDPQAEVLRALGRNAFTSLSQDIYDLTMSGTKVIGRVIGNFNIGLGKDFFDETLSIKEQDKRREEWEKYVSSGTYQYLFKHDVTQVGNKSLYGGLYITKPVGWYSEEQWGGDRVTIAAGNWLMNNILATEEIGVTRRVSEYHQELIRSRESSNIERQYGKYADITERVREVSNQLLTDVDYVAKPGIRSAIAFIESADRELTIDLFQLQNKAVADVLIKKLERESGRIARGEFKFQLRLAGPTQNDRRNMVGHQILGPNIVVMERLYNLQKKILDKEFDLEATATASNKIAISNEERALDINNKIAKLLPSFTLEMMDEGMYHPKVYTSEKYAMLGSFNLTSPVGNSVMQAGSNYEEIVIFHNRMRHILDPISNGFDTTASITEKMRLVDTTYKQSGIDIRDYMSFRDIGTLESRGLSKKDERIEEDKAKEYIDTHLYLQTRSLAIGGIRRDIGGQAFTGRQVGLAGDIGQGLRSILSYAKGRTGMGSDRRVEVYMNLNQVWLLQYDNDLYYGKGGDFRGEFGPDSNRQRSVDELIGKRGSGRRDIYRNEIQENLFDLILNNQAYISVDLRNYRERVLEPMTEKVHYLLGKAAVDADNTRYKPKGWIGGTPSSSDFTDEDYKRIGAMKFEREYNSSLRELTGRHGDKSSLLKVLGLDVNGVNYRESLNNIDQHYGIKIGNKGRDIVQKGVDRTVKQLLAMTRGNIIGVTETMSHVKNVFAIERSGLGIGQDSYRHIASITGSSNFGSESMAFSRDDKDKVSSEVGVISLAREMREYAQSKGLLYRNEEESLDMDLENFYAQQGTDREREWRRLTQTTVANVDTSLESSRASWENRVNASGIAEITARVKQLNKDMGLSQGGLKVKNIYGQSGSLIALELTINPSDMVGYRGFQDTNVGFSPIKFRLTALKGGMGTNQGFVYLIDQNKVIGNSLFVNNTDKDIAGIPYGENSFIRNEETGEYELNPRVVKSKETLKLSPIDSLINMVSTLAAETTYRTLVAEPMAYMKALKNSQYNPHTTRLGIAGLGYLEYLSRGYVSSTNDTSGESFLLDKSLTDYEISKLIHTFTNKHLGKNVSGTSKRALELAGGSIYEKLSRGEGVHNMGSSKEQIFGDTDLALRRAVVNYLEVIRDANRSLGKADISEYERASAESNKKNAVGALKEVFDKYMGLESVSTFQSDIALGILESRRDFLYTAKLASDIKEIVAGMLEPFITQSQASTYGTSQAWLKNPLYGINNNQQLFIDKVTKGEALYRYALAQSYIFGPSSTTGRGTEGAIRGVAAGGAVSASQESTGLSMYGINKTPIGDISSVHMASFAGVGYVYGRDQYVSYISELLYEKYSAALKALGIKDTEELKERISSKGILPIELTKDFKDLIDATPFKDETVNESLNYTFNVVKKASQIPQRLKNVMGGRPMFEINRDISYRLITKGDVLGLVNERVTGMKVELMTHIVKNESSELRRAIDILKDVVNTTNSAIYTPSRILEEVVKRASLEGINIEPSILMNDLRNMWNKVEIAIGTDMNIAMINDAGFRGVLNNELATLIDEAKNELKDEFGFLDSEFLPGSTSIARKLLLSRAKLADSMAGGIKGFTGGREGFDPIVLVQMTGDFSDYAWANPLYGSTKEDREFITSKLRSVGYEWSRLDKASQAEVIGRMGTMSGFIEKSEKRQKSSKLSEEWSYKGVRLADKGDIVTFDSDTNRVLVWGSAEEMMRQGGGTPKEIINMDKYSKEAKLELIRATLGDKFDKYYTYSDMEGTYVTKSVVDSRDQVGALTEVIDNFRTINDLPNVSKLDRQAWHRASENSVEYILDSKQLMGNADNNQLLWEMIYLRSSMIGGGKRVEGTGGLPKAVLKFTGLEELYETPGGKTDFFSYVTHQLNERKGGAIGDIDVGQVFGLFSPSNLKSYFYSHGSTIIRNRKYLEPLIGGLETKQGGITGKGLIASLMMGFGDSWISDKTIGAEIKTQLFESAMRGDLGEWFKNQALGALLTAISKSEEVKSQLDRLGLRNDLSKLSQVLDSNSPGYKDTLGLRTELGRIFGDAVFKKSTDLFNAQQTPSLQLLEDVRVLGALRGNQEDMEYMRGFIRSRLLESIGDRGSVGVTKRDFIRIDDPREREASLIAASIDLVEQLRAQGTGIEIPSEIDYDNDRIIQQLAFIMGDPDLDKIQMARDLREKKRSLDNLTKEEEEAIDYLEMTRAIVRGYTHRSTVLRMFIGPMASQSKESIGSKHTGALEFQHLMKPMITVVNSFEETGSIASLRKVVANMMAVVSEGSTMTGIELDLAKRGFRDKKVYDITDIRLASQLNKSDFLGLYAGYSAINKEQLSQLENDYKTYGELSRRVIEAHLNKLAGATDIEERMDSLRAIHDLLISSPNYDELYIDPFTGEIDPYDSRGGRIRKIFSTAFKSQQEGGLGLTTDIKDVDGLIDRISDERLMAIGREYQIDPNKPFGMGSVAPVLDNLKYKGFSFSLPMIYQISDESHEGSMRIQLDFTDKRYSYLMGSDELKAIGDSYGSFVDELVAKSLTLVSAFTPGTVMSQVREKMTRAQLSGIDEIDLTKEELLALKQFYGAAIGETGIIRSMAEASTGTRIQGMMGHKTKYPGAVTSPAASWMVPMGHMVLAQEALRRYTGISPVREEISSSLRIGLSNIDSNSPLYKLEQTLYRAGIRAVESGLSQIGTNLIDLVNEYKREFQTLNLNDATDRRRAKEISNRLQAAKDSIDVDENSGDNFGRQLARMEKLKIDIALGDIDEYIGSQGIDVTESTRKTREYLTNAKTKAEENLASLSNTRRAVVRMMRKGLYKEVITSNEEIAISRGKINALTLLVRDPQQDIPSLIDREFPNISESTRSRLEEEIYSRLGINKELDFLKRSGITRDIDIKNNTHSITEEEIRRIVSILKSDDYRVAMESASLLNSERLKIRDVSNKIKQSLKEKLPISSSDFAHYIFQELPSISQATVSSISDVFEQYNKQLTLREQMEVLQKERRAITDRLKPSKVKSIEDRTEVMEALRINTESITDVVNQQKKLVKLDKLTGKVATMLLSEYNGLTQWNIDIIKDKLEGLVPKEVLGAFIKDIAKGKDLPNKLGAILVSDLDSRALSNYEAVENEFNGVISNENHLKSFVRSIVQVDLNDKTLEQYRRDLRKQVVTLRKQVKDYQDRLDTLPEDGTVVDKYHSTHNRDRKYSTREEAVSALVNFSTSNIDSSIESLILNKHLMEGSYRGKVKAYSFDRDYLKDLSSDDDRREMFSFVLEEMNKGFINVVDELERRDKDTFKISEVHKGITDSNRQDIKDLVKAIESIKLGVTSQSLTKEQIEQIDSLISKKGTANVYSLLGTTKEEVEKLGSFNLKGKKGFDRAINLLEVSMNSLDISDSLEALSFRSPPVGGSEQQRMVLGLIQDIGLLNAYSQQQSGNKATFENSVRNKGLSLVAPISFLTMNLGDFDGDQYTTIFSQFMSVQRDIEKSNILIRKKEYDLTELEKKIGMTTEPDLVVQLNNKINKLKSDIQQEKSKIVNFNSQLDIWKENLNSSEFAFATKKEVANYMGIRKEFLMSKEEGGYQRTSPSLDLVFTFIEQGRGLFGGMEDVIGGTKPIRTVLNNLFNENIQVEGKDTSLFDILTTEADTNKLDQTLVASLESIVRNDRDKKNEATYLSLLMVDQEARKTLITTVKDSLNSYVLPINEQGKGQEKIDKDVVLAHASSAFYARYRGLPGLQSVLAQGAGVNMTLSAYDSMVKVMGEAGGVVLGKTYNTFIGTLYADSPLLALSHVLKDESTREVLRQGGFFDRPKAGVIKGGIDIYMTEDTFFSELDKSTQQSEGILSFIKSVNQLLRDGIKPKGGSTLLDDMKNFSIEYESLINDPSAQQALVKEKASMFGPSGSNVGMSAFMELSDLISQRESLSKSTLNSEVRMNSSGELVSPWGREEFGETETILRTKFSMDGDEFDRLSRQLITNYKREKVSAFDVAALKTQRSLETLIIAYRYNTATGAEGYEKGSQMGFMNKIRSGTLGLMEKEGIYNPALDERANLQAYVDNKFNESTAEGSRNLYILEQMFGKDREDIKRNYLDISSQAVRDGRKKDMQYEVLSMVEMIETTTSMTKGMMGVAGEGLRRFSTLEGARQEAISVIGGKSDKSINPGMGMDIWTSLMNLAGSNKLSSHAIPVIWEAFGSSEVLSSMYSNGGDHIEGLLPSLLSGVIVTGEGDNRSISFAHRGGRNVGQGEEENLRLMLYRILDEGQNIEVEVGEGSERVKKNLAKYITDKLETTAAVAKGKALMEMMNKLYGPKADVESYLNGSLFVEGIINRKLLIEEERKKAIDELAKQGLDINSKVNKEQINRIANERVNEYTRQLQGKYESAMEEFMFISQKERRNVNNNRLPQEINNNPDFDYMNLVKAESNANKLSGLQDFIIPAALTLIGSAVLGGRLDREVLGDVVGSSLIAASMSKGNILSSMMAERVGLPTSIENNQKGSFIKSGISTLVKAGVGGSFKLNLALQESEGDLSKAMAITAAREVGFMLGSAVLAPLVEKGLTDSLFYMSHAMKGQRELFEKSKIGKLSKEDKLMYMLGSTKGAIDSDSYVGTKGAALTVSGAVLSGILGMTMEGIAGSLIAGRHDTGTVNDFAVIDQALDALNNSKARDQSLAAERESSPDVVNEQGDSIYVDDINPFDEEFFAEAVDTDWMSIDMLEASVTSENSYELMVV